jgi:hypothetical protein
MEMDMRIKGGPEAVNEDHRAEARLCASTAVATQTVADARVIQAPMSA